METMQLLPVNNNNSIFKRYINERIIEDTHAEIISYPVINKSITNEKHTNHFIEANTTEVDINHLKQDCVIPVFSKDNEITISHSNFIETVWDAANQFFKRETLEKPDIRVSHVIKGRTPDAIYKPVNQLLDADKTIYYERMAFCFETPSITETIDGNRLNLSIGGVRAYNHENLYSKKSAEKFKIFIGFKNLVCCNLCVSTDGFKEEIKALSCVDLFEAMMSLFQLYNPSRHINLMQSLKDSYLPEHQFAQLIGKSKLYQCLPNAQKKLLPDMSFTDNHISAIAKSYYQDENFSISTGSDAINLWKVYNLFTGANKSSYIDSFLDRSVNALELANGINKALHGDNEYKWFIQ